VYDREIKGRTLTFGVSGMLYRNSLIMFDRETGSLWSHFLGAAVQGPLKGTRLRFIPSSFTTWGAWRAEHPDTLVLDARGVDPYKGYYVGFETGILGTRRRDERLPAKELVLGVLAPAAKAYALRDLKRLGRIRDTLAGKQVEISYDAASGTAAAFLLDRAARRPLLSTPVFWFAWVDFFPGAPLWEPPQRARPADSASGGTPSPAQPRSAPPRPVQ